MPWQRRVRRMIGNAVGVSLIDGRGTSGILCGMDREVVYLLEYLYQDQFALKQYPIDSIEDINTFPPCQQRRPLY